MNATRIESLKAALSEKRMVKAIAGIANVNLENVLNVVRAAERAGADAVDVAASPEIVKAARAHTGKALFASAIDPEALSEAVGCGADVAEIGNFDALYAEGEFITHEQVLAIARETVRLLQGKALISVTVPGHLSVDTQVQLVKALEALGVDMIQTEGAARLLSPEAETKALTAEEKASISFANTRALAAATRLPLITASGINAANAAQAMTHGASAIGVGSAVNRLETENAMAEVLEATVTAVVAAARPVAGSARSLAS